MIIAGTHTEIPPYFRCGGNIDWLYEMSIDTPYNIGVEQLDWNKLIGVKKSFFSPMEHSLMIGWRLDLKQNVNELSFYKHDNGKRIIGEVLCTVALKERFKVGFKQVGKRVKCTLYVRNLVFEDYLDGNFWYLINTWFGGNSVSPVNLKTTRIKLS